MRSARFFTDRQIGAALEAAARGHHDHYRRGTVTIVYANSNAKLLKPKQGYATLDADRARLAGRQQAAVVRGLHTFAHQRTAVGGNIEPGYDYGTSEATRRRRWIEHRLHHPVVLAGRDHDRLVDRAASKREDHGHELDRLGSSADNDRDLQAAAFALGFRLHSPEEILNGARTNT